MGVRTKSVDVLLVEDDADLRALYTLYLSRNGCTVRAVATGEEGLRECRRLTPQVLMTDATLPGISGADLVRAVRSTISHPASIAVLGITGAVEPGELHTVADEVLVKPVQLTLLAERVHALAHRGNAVSSSG